MLYINTAFLQRHGRFQCTDPSDPLFFSLNIFHCHIKDFRVPDPEDLLCQFSHSQHIIICVHRIVREVALDHPQDPPAYEVLIIDLFQR